MYSAMEIAATIVFIVLFFGIMAFTVWLTSRYHEFRETLDFLKYCIDHYPSLSLKQFYSLISKRINL